MNGLWGWFSNAGEDDRVHALQPAPGGAPDEAASLRVAAAAALDCGRSEPGAALAEFDGLWLATVGHPRWRGAAATGPGLDDIARALKLDAMSALPQIGGDFALIFWDTRSRRGGMAVDRIGVHQLFYADAQGAMACAATLDALGALPGVRRELSPQGLFDYLFYHVSPGPGTVFAGQRRVEPGHVVVFGHEVATQSRPYWSMRFHEQPGSSPAALKEEFRALLRDTVGDAANGAASGAFLSGGTDSSTVSGMLAQVSNRPPPTFSIGFDVEGYDEMSYARVAARHFGCDHHEYYVTADDVVSAVPRIAAFYDQPFGNASAIPTYYCARLAREHGIGRLLAGDGGDELFGGNERYAKHHLLGLYQRVPSGLRRGLLEPLLMAQTPLHRMAPLRKLRSYVEQARPPMPQRYESYNLLNHLGVGNVLQADFLAAIDPQHPHQLMVEAHAPYAGASLVNQMLAIDLRFTLADGDLPKVTRMCQLAGVDVAFPLLDERLIEFSGRLASDLKLRGTQLRWFFKQALADFLPREVITKHKHGFGLPVGAWLVGHRPLRDLALESLALLKSRRIVKPDFIDELMANKLGEHPAYYGTMVWVLMMLGLWLDSRRL